MAEEKTISVKQIKSVTGSYRNQRLSLKGLGLIKINHVVQVKDSKAIIDIFASAFPMTILLIFSAFIFEIVQKNIITKNIAFFIFL